MKDKYKKRLELGLAVVGLIVEHGLPAAVKLMNTWETDRKDVTVEDIDRLKNSIKTPDEYMID